VDRVPYGSFFNEVWYHTKNRFLFQDEFFVFIAQKKATVTGCLAGLE